VGGGIVRSGTRGPARRVSARPRGDNRCYLFFWNFLLRSHQAIIGKNKRRDRGMRRGSPPGRTNTPTTLGRMRFALCIGRDRRLHPNYIFKSRYFPAPFIHGMRHMCENLCAREQSCEMERYIGIPQGCGHRSAVRSDPEIVSTSLAYPTGNHHDILYRIRRIRVRPRGY